jgi:hypothetical protein
VHNLQNSRVKATIVARTQGEPLSMTNAIRDGWSLDRISRSRRSSRSTTS